MRIIQQIGPHQILKITTFQVLAQETEGLAALDVHQRFLLIIQPAFQTVSAVDQALWITAEICFFISEFQGIQAGDQGVLVQALVCRLLKFFLNDSQESFCIFRLRIFDHDAEIRLQDPVLVRRQNIFSNALFQ